MRYAIRLFPLLCVAAALAPAQTQLIGISSVTATLDNDSAGQAEAFEQTAFFTGTVSTLSVYLDSSNGAKKLIAGVYSNGGGHPNRLLGSGSLASPIAGSWNTVAISPPVPVIAGTAYHIALLGTGGAIEFRDTENGTHSETSSQTNLTNLPAA